VTSPDGRYAYLGPAGTFTEAALLACLGELGLAGSAELVPAVSVGGALESVRSGATAAAMVPLENSVEGSVSATLDELAFGTPLVIRRETHLPVAFALLGRPGTSLSDVRTVGSHPHAQPQCRRWLSAHLPDAEWVAAASNADAARLVGEGRLDAALAGAFAAQVYGLEVLADQVHDVSGAETRFVLVSRPVPPEPSTGSDKTSLVLVIGKDHPGALLEILTEFAVRGINLTRIESRPTGGGIGDYFFSVDAEGHIDEARVGEALIGLHRICADVRFLGSYPRADGARPVLRRGVSDTEYSQAQAWLARIRDGRS
jgi:prephenate dehydratase